MCLNVVKTKPGKATTVVRRNKPIRTRGKFSKLKNVKACFVFGLFLNRTIFCFHNSYFNSLLITCGVLACSLEHSRPLVHHTTLLTSALRHEPSHGFLGDCSSYQHCLFSTNPVIILFTFRYERVQPGSESLQLWMRQQTRWIQLSVPARLSSNRGRVSEKLPTY